MVHGNKIGHITPHVVVQFQMTKLIQNSIIDNLKTNIIPYIG